MSKQELNDCLKSSYTSARKQDGSYYKTSSMKSIRAAIDRFLRSPPHCKQFSIIGDPAFTEANQVLDAFVIDLDHDCEVRHIKAVIGHKSDSSIESYNLPS